MSKNRKPTYATVKKKGRAYTRKTTYKGRKKSHQYFTPF